MALLTTATSTLLLIAACFVCLSFAQTNAGSCSDGEFFSPGNNSCVTECPCGMQGNTYFRVCKQVQSNREAFYSKSSFSLHGNTHETPFATFSLLVQESFMKNVSRMDMQLNANCLDQDSGYYIFGCHGFQQLILSGVRIEYNDQLTHQGSLDPINVYNSSNTTLQNSGMCSNGNQSYHSFSVKIYFANITGSFWINLAVQFQNDFRINQVGISGDILIHKGCSNDSLSYKFSTDECVETCPCGSFSFYGSCQPNQFFNIDAYPKTITVTSQSEAGSKIGTINFFINANNTMIYIYAVSKSYIIIYNNSGEQTYHHQYIYPTFHILASKTNDTVSGRFWSHLQFLDIASAQCVHDSTTYLTVPFDIILSSDSLYHLGDQFVYFRGYVHPFSYFSRTKISFRVQAECENKSLLYDFTTHECVSECPCGFAPFRLHHTAYCRAETYHLVKFLNERSLVQIPFNAPPSIITTNINFYINLPDWYGSFSSAIVARLTLVSSYSGISLPVNNTILPEVTLVAPNGTEGAVIDIPLQNDSDYAKHCYKTLHDIAFLSVRVNIYSPLMYTQLGQHDFVVELRLFSPSLNFLYYQYRDSHTLAVNITNNGSNEPHNPIGQLINEGIDYLPFLEPEQMTVIPNMQDSSSPPIAITFGLPFGNDIQHIAYVSENGAISFANPWPYSFPSRFPTNWYWTRNQYVLAPFWSDNDIRQSGSVRYANLTLQGDSIHDDELIKTVSRFIRHQHDDADEHNFEGQWMLVAYWDGVHPYPHGSTGSYYSNYYGEFTQKENSYQALVITDYANTYAVFTYNCGMLEWSGNWQHAVVGYNARGDTFTNHPASGFKVFKTAVACPNNLLYKVPWNNIVYKISPPPNFEKEQRMKCQKLYKEDLKTIGSEEDIKQVLEQLEPCPCSAWQARRDWGRFWSELSNGFCFVQRIAVELWGFKFTQQCCYAPTGSEAANSLITSGINGGSLLSWHPYNNYEKHIQYDRELKEACCGIAGHCDLYYKRRPSHDCSGYDPPAWTWGWGDPHITTLDGRTYTFNGWGEYILLEHTLEEGNTTTQFVLQGRTSPVNDSTSNSATQFSAFAFGVPGDSSFQVEIVQGEFQVYSTSEEVKENITEFLAQVNGTYNTSSGDMQAELSREEKDTIIATFSNGVGCLFSKTAGILNFLLSLPPSFMGQTRGLLGNNNGDKTDEFIKRGTINSMPDNLTDEQIFSFGQTWNVSEYESLFSYHGSSYAAFQHLDHTPLFVTQLNPTAEQIAVCGEDQQCLYDFVNTGNKKLAVATIEIANKNTKDSEILHNFPPNITGKNTFMVNVGQLNIFNFTVEDTDSNITVHAAGGLPTNALLIATGGIHYSLHYSPTVVANHTLTLIATDPHGASSTFTPKVYFCACDNGGDCTLEGIAESDDEVIVMNCACSEAYSGRYCKEDRNGCSEVQCYVESSCHDIPAPGVGAECGPCPSGLTGDGNKCLDINECQVNTSACDQVCSNTEGSYTCSCQQGYKMTTNNHCIDINECLMANDCQQECVNTEGNYKCDCNQGFNLNIDNTSCDPVVVCPNSHGCSHGCAIVNGTQQCFCPKGFYLINTTQCNDVNECVVFSPCEQVCTNTIGSFQCSCRKGFHLQSDTSSCADVNECLEAAINSSSLCSDNSECTNTHGSYMCVCAPGYDLINGTCQRFQEKVSTPLQVVPTIALENLYNFTITSLDVTFNDERKQLFRETTASVINDYCSINICSIVPLSGDTLKQITGFTIYKRAVAIPSSLLTHDDKGQTVVGFYIQIPEGFVAFSTIKHSVEAGKRFYQDAGFINIVLPYSESLASSPVTSTELLKPTVHSTPHVVTIDQFVLTVAVPVGVGCAAIVVVLTAILITAVCMKLSKKKTATAANNTGGFSELENVIKSKDFFEMPEFSNPAKVDEKVAK